MDYFLAVLGLVCFLEGLPYFAFPEQLKKWMMQVIEMPENRLRILGGALMIVGVVLVYLARRQAG
jgi:uncharacterized protein